MVTDSVVSTTRLNVMRALYFLMAFMLGAMVWPPLLRQSGEMNHMHGVAVSLFCALTIVSALGIRYPLQMLPVLLFEFAWKAIWLLAIGLPHYFAGSLAGGNAATFKDNTVGIILCIMAIPWGYAWRTYARQPGERWLRRRNAAPATA